MQVTALQFSHMPGSSDQKPESAGVNYLRLGVWRLEDKAEVKGKHHKVNIKTLVWCFAIEKQTNNNVLAAWASSLSE